jgi:hypothetical protein
MCGRNRQASLLWLQLPNFGVVTNFFASPLYSFCKGVLCWGCWDTPKASRRVEMIGYRIQDRGRDIDELLDPEQQWSFPASGDDDLVRRGVSVMDSLADLAAYVAVTALLASYPVLVEVEGPESDDVPVDADMGEQLLLPTRATVIAEDEEFFQLVSDLVDLHETGIGFEELREVAESRI